MTCVFNMNPEGLIIGVDKREWSERFPVGQEDMREHVKITHAWQTGSSKLLPEQMPYAVVAEKSRKSWPDMFMVSGGILVVHQKAKDIIEGLDPGLHQFFPLTIHTKGGLEVEGPWFAMNVTEEQESIVKEKSMVYHPAGAMEGSYSFYYEDKDVTVDPSKQSGIHLWRETGFFMSLLCSDTLFNALKAADLKFYRRFKAKDLAPSPSGN